MNSHSVVKGLVLIIAGILILMSNQGMVRISWSYFFNLLNYWPILLIALGIALLLGKRITARHVLTGVLVLFLIFLLWTAAASQWYLDGPLERISGDWQYYGNPSEEDPIGTVKLKFPAGKLELNAVSDSSDSLVRTRFSGYHEEPRLTFKEGDKWFSLDIRGNGNNETGYQVNFGRISEGTEVWQLEFKEGIPIEIDLDMGAGDVDLDFTNLDLRSLEANLGAGNVNIFLGDLIGEAQMQINLAAGNVTIWVPEDVGIYMTVNDLIGNVNYPDDMLIKNGNIYQTPDYVSKKGYYLINIDLAAGNVIVKER